MRACASVSVWYGFLHLAREVAAGGGGGVACWGTALPPAPPGPPLAAADLPVCALQNGNLAVWLASATHWLVRRFVVGKTSCGAVDSYLPTWLVLRVINFSIIGGT